MHRDREAEVARQPLRNGLPAPSAVIAAQHAERRVVFEAAVILHVDALGATRMRGDLVHALAELGKAVGLEAGADPSVLGCEALLAVTTGVMATRRDAEVE